MRVCVLNSSDDETIEKLCDDGNTTSSDFTYMHPNIVEGVLVSVCISSLCVYICRVRRCSIV